MLPWWGELQEAHQSVAARPQGQVAVLGLQRQEQGVLAQSTDSEVLLPGLNPGFSLHLCASVSSSEKWR